MTAKREAALLALLDRCGTVLSKIAVGDIPLRTVQSMAMEVAADVLDVLGEPAPKRKPAPKKGGKGWTLLTPKCEECDEEMVRYGPALDTGKMGWQCPECGWSWDDCPQWNPAAPKEGK